MSRLFISLLIGLVAGTIDVAPMIVLKIGRRDCISAFVHWIVVSILIAYVQMPVAPWLKGILVAVLSCLPVVISVSEKAPKSIVPILIMSVVLGAAVGFATFKYAK